MTFNYNGVWEVLIDKNMKKRDLIDKIGIYPTTISKMVRGNAVSLTVIGEIYEELDTDTSDKSVLKQFGGYINEQEYF